MLTLATCPNGHVLNFNKKGKCITCATEYIYTWRDRNPEKIKLYPKTINKKKRTPSVWKKDAQLFYRYKIRHGDYDEMLAAQDHKCAICKQPFDETRVPFVDHDHKNKKVRGLLCKKCNSGLGLLEDSLELLTAAISYLKR